MLTNILVHLRLAGLGLQHHIQRVYVVLRLDVHGVVVDENAVLTSDSISGQFLIVE